MHALIQTTAELAEFGAEIVPYQVHPEPLANQTFAWFTLMWMIQIPIKTMISSKLTVPVNFCRSCCCLLAGNKPRMMPPRFEGN